MSQTLANASICVFSTNNIYTLLHKSEVEFGLELIVSSASHIQNQIIEEFKLIHAPLIDKNMFLKLSLSGN